MPTSRLTRALSTIARLSSSRLPPLPLHLLLDSLPLYHLSSHSLLTFVSRTSPGHSFGVLYTLEPLFHIRHSRAILRLFRLSHFVLTSSSHPPRFVLTFDTTSLSTDSSPSPSTNHAITTSSSPLLPSISISTPKSALQSTHFSPRAIFSPPNKLPPSPSSAFCCPDLFSFLFSPSAAFSFLYARHRERHKSAPCLASLPLTLCTIHESDDIDTQPRLGTQQQLIPQLPPLWLLVGSRDGSPGSPYRPPAGGGLHRHL